MDTDDWLDCSATASLMTATGCVIMWQVNLGQRFETETWADYKVPGNLRIYVAYLTDKRPVVLEHDGATWTIYVSTMTQVTDTTATTKKTRRIVVVFRQGVHGLSKVRTYWTTLRH